MCVRTERYPSEFEGLQLERNQSHLPSWISDQFAGRVAIQSCIAGHRYAQHSFQLDLKQMKKHVERFRNFLPCTEFMFVLIVDEIQWLIAIN